MAGHKKAHVEKESGERWLVTYADMITLLMVFFIVMYSMANTDLKKFAQVAESMQVAFNVIGAGKGSGLLGAGGASQKPAAFLQDLPQQQRDYVSVSGDLSAFAAQTGLEGEISINTNIEGIIISLSDEMVFQPGSAELRPQAKETLHQVALILASMPNRVRIDGHTDNVPTNNPLYPTNWELSVARAVSIVRHLSEVEGIDPNRLSAAGHAEFKPLTDNTTRAHREMNRRAELVIIYPESSKSYSINFPKPEATTTPTE